MPSRLTAVGDASGAAGHDLDHPPGDGDRPWPLRAGVPLVAAGGTLLASALAAGLAAAAAAAGGWMAPGAAAGLGVLCAAVLAPLALVPWLRLAHDHHALQHSRLALPDLPVMPPSWNDRRQFLETIDREWSRCRRYDQDGALLLIDADHHAAVTQQHGREVADLMLAQCARVARATLRHPDLMARFGDEGMAVFLPHTDPLGALDVAERIRARVAATRLGVGAGDVVTTVSIGVAAIGASHASLDALIADAGRALHAAKDAGRNCVRSAPIQPRRSGESHSALPR